MMIIHPPTICCKLSLSLSNIDAIKSVNIGLLALTIDRFVSPITLIARAIK